MLIGARDLCGCANLFDCYEEKPPRYIDGVWDEVDGVELLLCGRNAEPFCRNIPPGQSRVIDLSASTIVHVQPVKTAVEELVKACERVLGGVSLMEDSAVSKDFRVVGTKAVSDLHFALARVRQEQQ